MTSPILRNVYSQFDLEMFDNFLLKTFDLSGPRHQRVEIFDAMVVQNQVVNLDGCYFAVAFEHSVGEHGTFSKSIYQA